MSASCIEISVFWSVISYLCYALITVQLKKPKQLILQQFPSFFNINQPTLNTKVELSFHFISLFYAILSLVHSLRLEPVWKSIKPWIPLLMKTLIIWKETNTWLWLTQVAIGRLFARPSRKSTNQSVRFSWPTPTTTILWVLNWSEILLEIPPFM